jgi:ketosteroid isomerase-like protein
MPQATLELMQSFVEALDNHDEAALLDLVHPEVEFKSLIQEVEGSFRGHQGVRAYLRDLFTAFPDWRVGVDEVREIGNTTVVKVHARAISLAGGVSIDLRDWLAMTSRDGRADWWAFFRTEAEAFEAARLADRMASANLDLVRSIYAAWERGQAITVWPRWPSAAGSSR